MSSEQDKVKELAARVARRLADAPSAGGDADSLRATLAEIQRRLAHIESHLAHDADCTDAAGRAPAGQVAPAQRRDAGAGRATPTRPTWLSGTYVPAGAHPSQERFANVGEAVAEMVEFFEGEKTCAIEPGEKPCDHCGVCSSRGF